MESRRAVSVVIIGVVVEFFLPETSTRKRVGCQDSSSGKGIN